MTGDHIRFADEIDATRAPLQPTWQVVVIDDDPEMHEATRFALRHVTVEGRGLELVHLHSADEARRVLPTLVGPAAILLDVVMETEDAGLRLVDFIRSECGFTTTRIILRTGQPGYAPELAVISRYDINDYFTKSELSRTRLITAITSAIKSHEQLAHLDRSRRGLEVIVRSTRRLLEPQALAGFAESVLAQARALLGTPLDGLVCAQGGSPLDPHGDRLVIIGATGAFAGLLWQPLSQLRDDAVVAAISKGLQGHHGQTDDRASVLYLSTEGREAAVYLAKPQGFGPMERTLLEVFGATLAACFSNLQHFEEAHRLAFRDPLTGLLNRAGLLRELDGVAGRRDLRLVLVDIDHFTDFNDGLGQETGDLLLAAVGQRLRERYGYRASVGRVGADVFALIGDAEQLRLGLTDDVFDVPFDCGEQRFHPSATLGLCDLGDCSDGLTALRHANLALKAAKRGGAKDAVAYSPAMAEHTRQRLDILAQLRRDLERGRLQLWYQPQVDLATGETVAVEALLRWPDGRGGWVQPPDVFIPLAEYSGLIVPLGAFVLEKACATLAGLRAGTGRTPRMAVNVALPQLRDAGFVEEVEQALARHGLSGDQLELEITESIAMGEAGELQARLAHLRRQGIRVAIDDFGTGYSSLARLRDLPVDALKIDRRFVSGLEGQTDEAFVACILQLAGRLGLATVAEGIETETQAQRMRQLGCVLGQGYWHARPMPEDALAAWLATR